MEDIRATMAEAMDLGDEAASGVQPSRTQPEGGGTDSPQQALPVASKVAGDDDKEPPSLEEAEPPQRNIEADEKMDTSSTSSSNDDDDDDGDGSPFSDETGISPERAELLLIKATGLKEEGNREFQGGQLDRAARSYRRGIAALKKLNRHNTGGDQVRALLVTLHTNLSTVLFRDKKYRVSAEVAGRAIQVLESNNKSNNNNDNNSTATHVKALYRRAVANRKLANTEEARRDLRAALAMDANNATCKRELVAIKKELESARESQKKALSKAFASSRNGGGGGGLYDDKEEIVKRREQEAKRKQKEEEELSKKRKQQWEDECVSRMAKGEAALSFDDWDQQRVEKEEAERKAEEDERRAAEKRRKEEQRKAKLAAKQKTREESEKDDDDDDDELTEAELAMFRGYKKTADGRTTSYFTRELSEEERKRIGDIAPKRLDEASSSGTSSNAPAQLGSNSTTTMTSNATSSDALKASGSAWNQAGTWEERDTTSWCTAQLRLRLEETTVTTETLHVSVVEIPALTGDASVAIVSGKKRYIFDFHVNLEYVIREVADAEEEGGSNTGKVVGSGVVRLPDICSTHHEEIAVDYEGWKKRPVPDKLDEATAVRQTLADHLRASVQRFVFDFNETY